MRRIVLIGKAGSGKDYFRDFMNESSTVDVSYTTRPPRKGEVIGYTYNYITEQDFISKRAEGYFLEAVNFNSWWYGTSLTNWNRRSVFIMTPSGIANIPKEDLRDCVLVYFDIPMDIRRGRLSKRSDADSVARRIIADEKDFKYFDKFDIKVTNPLFDPEMLYKLILDYSNL